MVEQFAKLTMDQIRSQNAQGLVLALPGSEQRPVPYQGTCFLTRGNGAFALLKTIHFEFR